MERLYHARMLAPVPEHERPAMVHHGAMTMVRDMEPGDILEMGGATATLIVTCSHPWYSSQFALVIWWLHAEQRYSFDALLWRQELIGRVVRGRSQDQRERAWREATKEGNL